MCYGAAFTMPGSFIRTKRSQPPSNTACSTTDLVRLCLLCEFTLKNSISGMKDLAVVLGISFNYKCYKFLRSCFIHFTQTGMKKQCHSLYTSLFLFCRVCYIVVVLQEIVHQVRLFFAEKRKPNISGCKNMIERGNRKILNFVIQR